MAETILDMIPCERCNTNISFTDWSEHMKDCVRDTAGRHENTKRIVTEEHTNDGIPCEYCDSTISLNDWEFHAKQCAEEHKKKMREATLAALVPCEYCNETICVRDLEIHYKQCVKTNGQLQNTIHNTEKNGSNEPFIPCEYCNVPIKLHEFEWHTRQCEETERKWRQHVTSADSNVHNALIPCEFCNQSIAFHDFQTHQVDCQRRTNALTLQNNFAGQNVLGSNSSFPDYWDLSSLQNLSRYILEPSSSEYKLVADNFHNTLSSNRILQIERIQNRRWYRQYDAHRDDFIERYGISTEEWLFHGCKGQSVDLIINDCFNRSHATRCAAGQGIYFALDARTSLTYTQPDTDKCRHMFMARVLVGKRTEGNQSTRVCPPGFDTTGVGSVYVTYHDAQAYGEYLITFT